MSVRGFFSRKNKQLNLLNDTERDGLATAIVFHITLMQCKNMVVSTSSLFFRYNTLLNIVALFLVILMYLRAIVKDRIYYSIDVRSCLIISLIFIWWCVSFIIDNKLFFENIFPYDYVRKQAKLFLVYCLPLFISCSYIKNPKQILDKMYDSANISFIFAAISCVLFIIDRRRNIGNTYSMSYGNQVLLCSVILMFRFFKKQKVYDLILLTLTILFIVVAGSRGPLVSIGALIVFAILIDKNKIRSVILMSFIFIFFTLFILFGEELFGFLATFLSKFGIRNRTIEMFAKGIGGYDSGRSVYHKTLLNAINEYPLTGLGAFGGEKTVGLSHSLYLDIFANFGYLFGGVFIVVLFYNILSCCVKHFNNAETVLILMMSFIILPRGFFDETFWGAWQLWIILGLFINRNCVCCRDKRLKNKKRVVIVGNRQS